MTVITVNQLMRQSNLCNNFDDLSIFVCFFIKFICAGDEKYRFWHQWKHMPKKTTAKKLHNKFIIFVIGVQFYRLFAFETV